MIGDPYMDISVVLKTGSLYMIILPANMYAYYSGEKVGGSGTRNVFVAIEGVNTVRITSAVSLIGTFDLVELLPSYYNLYDGLGGTLAFPKLLEKWSTKYSFRPDWMSTVGNRLVSFKKGKVYVHDGPVNTFYGERYNTVVAAVLSEENTVKTIDNVAIEGDIPDRMHFRTEKPNVQSSDLVASDFKVREGVAYAEIFRDRLSPNTTGTYLQKLLKGDRIRGEVCKFMYVLENPTTPKSLKFINLEYTPSTGQTV